ncbi:hypothetical protein IFU33_09195 [Pantoea agglomerans]|jgi:hypothetical protein|uniref:hypothetical protein n=1 Tax=Enterobacter agglomerans TaxID=549 RepID=UPI00178236AE|nr:hypothetical protein [Pantoea agglomerans]WVJ48145.1 hypothetical protein IFU33_09195 [Pantoea agglomerans]
MHLSELPDSDITRDYRLASGVPVFRPLWKHARLAVSGADPLREWLTTETLP